MVVEWLLPLAEARHELTIYPNASLSGRKQQAWLPRIVAWSKQVLIPEVFYHPRDLLSSASACLTWVHSQIWVSPSRQQLLLAFYLDPQSSLLLWSPKACFLKFSELCKEISLTPEREDVLSEPCSCSTLSKSRGRPGLQTVWLVKEKQFVGDVQNQVSSCKTPCKQK